MGPRERRLIRRFRIVATALVALMLGAMVWTVVNSGVHGSSSASQSNSSSSDSSSSSSSND